MRKTWSWPIVVILTVVYCQISAAETEEDKAYSVLLNPKTPLTEKVKILTIAVNPRAPLHSTFLSYFGFYEPLQGHSDPFYEKREKLVTEPFQKGGVTAVVEAMMDAGRKAETEESLRLMLIKLSSFLYHNPFPEVDRPFIPFLNEMWNRLPTLSNHTQELYLGILSDTPRLARPYLPYLEQWAVSAKGLEYSPQVTRFMAVFNCIAELAAEDSAARRFLFDYIDDSTASKFMRGNALFSLTRCRHPEALDRMYAAVLATVPVCQPDTHMGYVLTASDATMRAVVASENYSAITHLVYHPDSAELCISLIAAEPTPPTKVKGRSLQSSERHQLLDSLMEHKRELLDTPEKHFRLITSLLTNPAEEKKDLLLTLSFGYWSSHFGLSSYELGKLAEQAKTSSFFKDETLRKQAVAYLIMLKKQAEYNERRDLGFIDQ